MPDHQHPEINEIKLAIARLEVRFDDHIINEEKHQKQTVQTLDTILRLVRGNGHPGMGTRLDRLEQREAGRAKALWIALTAGIGAVAKLIVDAIRNG